MQRKKKKNDKKVLYIIVGIIAAFLLLSNSGIIRAPSDTSTEQTEEEKDKTAEKKGKKQDPNNLYTGHFGDTLEEALNNIKSSSETYYDESQEDMSSEEDEKKPAGINKFDEAQFVRAVDGDTIIVNLDGKETTVRLLEVDTPESVSPNADENNEYGDKASEFTKNYFANIQTVYLCYDKERTDQYGRTLAYVWLNKDAKYDSSGDVEQYMYNSILLSSGMARLTVYAPNDYYQDEFTTTLQKAQEDRTGLWQYDEYWQIAARS